jgi:3-oxoacyl-ACP reductase-like protein
MGILNSIKEKIFGKNPAEVKPSASAPSIAATGMGMPAAAAAMAAAQAKAAPVDVEAVLEAAVKAKGVKLNWRESIVDLMKALDLDSSLSARKELAADLKYSGSAPDGSAEKNIWLHKALMIKLAENGGRIPKNLLS